MFDLTFHERRVIFIVSLIILIGSILSHINNTQLGKKISTLTPIKSISNTPFDKPSCQKPINIKTASISQLTQIPGIGPAIAQRIIQYRIENKNFTDLADIKKIKGIGDKKFKKIEKFITLKDQPK